jgi:hypothetical protein
VADRKAKNGEPPTVDQQKESLAKRLKLRQKLRRLRKEAESPKRNGSDNPQESLDELLR